MTDRGHIQRAKFGSVKARWNTSFKIKIKITEVEDEAVKKVRK